MATVTWPLAALPAYPLAQGYKLSEAGGVIRTGMDDGLARQRKKYPGMPLTVRCGWLLSADRMAFFRGWLTHRAAHGATWINVTLDVGHGVEQVEARFVGDPDYTRVRKGLWLVAADLEVLPPAVMSLENVEVAEVYGVDGLRIMGAGLPTCRLLEFFDFHGTWFGR